MCASETGNGSMVEGEMRGWRGWKEGGRCEEHDVDGDAGEQVVRTVVVPIVNKRVRRRRGAEGEKVGGRGR